MILYIVSYNMSSFEKLVRKLLSMMLGGFSLVLVTQSGKNPGSECIFHRKGSYPINVPTIRGRYVKTPYVKRIVKIIELEEYLESFEGD